MKFENSTEIKPNGEYKTIITLICRTYFSLISFKQSLFKICFQFNSLGSLRCRRSLQLQCGQRTLKKRKKCNAFCMAVNATCTQQIIYRPSPMTFHRSRSCKTRFTLNIVRNINICHPVETWQWGCAECKDAPSR